MQMKVFKKSFWLLLFIIQSLFVGDKIFAQRTLIDVSIDSAAILIGEQTVLHTTVTIDRDKQVRIVIPGDTLMRGVEVLNFSRPDSSVIDNNRLLIKQDILITSFDSALYLLPPLKVIDGPDTVYSNQVALKVSTIPVDTDNPEDFFDIKEVWKPPFVLADYYPWIFGVLIALFLICVAGYIVQRMRNRKPLVPFRREAPKLPPYEQAITELNRVKQRKLWQQGRSKEYYTSVTEILRRYIVARFGINAMEMTSGEILDIIKRNSEADSAYENLKQILQLADFVKFAKWNPLPDENDLSMMNAYLFVNQTKPAIIAAPDTKEDEEAAIDTNDSTLTKE
jgi:hypothetical protein